MTVKKKSIFEILIFKKNDIYRFIGITAIIGGQFVVKDIKYSGFGLNGGLNLIQAAGLLLFLFPFVTRYFESKKA